MFASLSDTLLKQHLGERSQNKEKVERAVREWFRIQTPEFWGNKMLSTCKDKANPSVY
jgi:ribosomal protein S3AE